MMSMKVDEFLDECLCHEIQKANTPNWVRLQMKFERIIAARMLNNYNKNAKKAVSRAANMVGRGESLENIIRTVKSQMKTIFTENDIKRINKDIMRYFVSDRVLSANEFKIDVSDKIETVTIKGSTVIQKAEIDVAFDLSDRKILETIESQNLIAAQNLFKLGLSAHVVSVISTIVKTTGISSTAQKALIQSEMAKALGLKRGEVDLENIKPPKFKGTSKDYYTGLAQTTLTRAQVMGRLNLFSQGDFKTYRIQAIIDKRTSVICQFMDQRIFTIDQGERHIQKVLGATSSDQLKQIAGWRRDLSEFGIKNFNDGKTGAGAAAVSKTLADAGLPLPPYHFRCRSTVRPIS